ncbi:ccaat-binding factor complex subunit [Grosmannia clavigera kw1407]|uniref:Ccaat-binding factor complex subunit n=1 Tax=Grosmannia clavigera (strain kw1407 / UAMH 11150) TaxID=655863 RepID=F0X9E1_GROCL|nr:ccaat-binding factor complex subunit [Grosmannia clavigera kw1407]EFX05803.1 ccaat-binding factor complex subunit [Grosmannia clavigera kw1407]
MNDSQDPQSSSLGYEFEVKEQDRWLPIANETPLSPYILMSRHQASPSESPDGTGGSSMRASRHDVYDANIRNFAPVARIMKNALPENAKIAKEAKECMQECVSEFISFITSEASEKCHQEKRKTVNGEDILFAMTSLGFENYAEALKIYLSKYREVWSIFPVHVIGVLLCFCTCLLSPFSNASWQQSQSNRGDNQQGHPGGQGYGTAGAAGAGAPAGSFEGGPDLSGQPAEGGADASGYIYGAQTGHNGAAGGDGY